MASGAKADSGDMNKSEHAGGPVMERGVAQFGELAVSEKIWRMALRCVLILLVACTVCIGFSGCRHTRHLSPVEARRQAIDLLTQGERYEAEGEYQLALEFFIQAAERSPRPAIFYHMGHCYAALGQYEQAIPHYQEALSLAPDYALAKYELAQAEYQANRLYDAEQPGHRVQRAPASLDSSSQNNQQSDTEPKAEVESRSTPTPSDLESHDAAPGAHVSAAAETKPLDISTETSSPTLSEVSIKKTEQGVPDLRKVKHLLFERESGNNAVQRYDKQDSMILGSFAYHFQKAESFRKKMMYQEAIGEYEDALKLNPRHVQCHMMLADTSRKLKRFDRAEQYYLAALDLAPDNAEIYFKLGNLYLEQKRYPQAVTSYTRSVELNPEQCNVVNNLGVVYMKQNEYEKALEAFRHVLVLDPGFANAYLNLGIIFSDVYRDRTKALLYFEKYVELDGPRKDEVRAWMAELKP